MIAGEGFIILPTVMTTLPTNRFEMELKALRKLTLLLVTEHEKVWTATLSMIIERQETFEARVYYVGKMSVTEAFAGTYLSKNIQEWIGTKFGYSNCLAFDRT